MASSHGESVLWLNDEPTRIQQHGHFYDPAEVHVIAVTYVTANGRVTRVNFDPHTGEPSIQRWHEVTGRDEAKHQAPDRRFER